MFSPLCSHFLQRHGGGGGSFISLWDHRHRRNWKWSQPLLSRASKERGRQGKAYLGTWKTRREVGRERGKRGRRENVPLERHGLFLCHLLPRGGCSLLPPLAGLVAPTQDPLRCLSPPTSTYQVGVPSSATRPACEFVNGRGSVLRVCFPSISHFRKHSQTLNTRPHKQRGATLLEATEAQRMLSTRRATRGH